MRNKIELYRKHDSGLPRLSSHWLEWRHYISAILTIVPISKLVF